MIKKDFASVIYNENCENLAQSQFGKSYKKLQQNDKKWVEIVVGLDIMIVLGEIIFKSMLKNLDKEKVSIDRYEVIKEINKIGG